MVSILVSIRGLARTDVYSVINSDRSEDETVKHQDLIGRVPVELAMTPRETEAEVEPYDVDEMGAILGAACHGRRQGRTYRANGSGVAYAYDCLRRRPKSVCSIRVAATFFRSSKTCW